ncbi:hypothetical protein [Tenacibaculum sp. 47A_GOM-205m]|uniref:hypothetical protein n=1 Tax=Tenacibaculum sp. 47A_GOM-205m TaxID=1380384 RepID=UPI00048C40E7|nr:hypothetical protein [Tenacibaculum sp. 47A_GOM-205m]
MTKEELSNYQKLTVFQKNIVDSLKNLGFEHRYFSTYELDGWGKIKVDKYSRWSDVLKDVFQKGKDAQRFEIQRALGIN